MSETTKTAMADGTYLAATLAGRCANGYERDQGSRVHAVQYSETLARNGYATDAAACGAKPGRRSAGWSLRTDLAVNCPRCIKRIAGVSASDGKTGRAACASFRCVRNKGHDSAVNAAASATERNEMKPQDATDAEALRLTQAHEVGWAEDYRAAMERAAVIADEYVAEQGRTRGLVNNYHAKGGIACAAAIRAEAAKEAK